MVWMLKNIPTPQITVVQSVKLQKIPIGFISTIFQIRARRPCIYHAVSQPFIHEMTIMHLYVYAPYIHFMYDNSCNHRWFLDLERNMLLVFLCSITYGFYQQIDTVLQVYTSLIIAYPLTCSALLRILQFLVLNTVLEVRRPRQFSLFF